MDKTKIIITSIIGVVIVIGAWLIAAGFKNFQRETQHQRYGYGRKTDYERPYRLENIG